MSAPTAVDNRASCPSSQLPSSAWRPIGDCCCSSELPQSQARRYRSSVAGADDNCCPLAETRADESLPFA